MSKLPFPVPDRRAVLMSGAASLVLAACGNIIGPPEASQMYLLKAADETSAPGPNVGWSLAVGSPSAPDSLDTQRIALVRSATLDYYANAEWPDQLTQIVQNALVEGFEKSGRIAQVSPDSAGLHADYVLMTEVRDFQARYDQPDGIPTAVVTIAAKLVNSRSREIVATTVASHEVPSSQNSIDAAVAAFGSAFGATVADIVNWGLSAAPDRRTE